MIIDAQIRRPEFSARFRPGIPRLRPGNSLLVGLMDCHAWTAGAGPPASLAFANARATTSSTPPGWTGTPFGLGGFATGGNYFNVPLGAFADASRTWAIRCRFTNVSIPGAFTSIFEGTPASLYVGTSGAASFGAIAGNNVPAAVTAPAGQICDLVVCGDPNSPFPVTYYVNGVLVATVNGWSPQSAATISVGANTGGGGSNPNTVYYLFQTWARALTAQEILKAYTDPWGMFVFPYERVPLIGATAILRRPMVQII